ncbi:MAG TPA: cytochrome P460 family protein, partial [Vicinamibacteria bacterium]
MTTPPRGRGRLALAALVAVLAARADGARVLDDAPENGAASSAPVYDADGALLRPEGYQEWTFVGASLGLSYAEGAQADGPGEFHNVYLRPESYAAFRRTGRFPEGTVLVLELHEAAQKVAPGRHGLFEGKR